MKRASKLNQINNRKEEPQTEKSQIKKSKRDRSQIKDEKSHSSLVNENRMNESPMSCLVVDENDEEVEIFYTNVAQMRHPYEIEYQKEQEKLKKEEELKKPQYPFYETSYG